MFGSDAPAPCFSYPYSIPAGPIKLPRMSMFSVVFDIEGRVTRHTEVVEPLVANVVPGFTRMADDVADCCERRATDVMLTFNVDRTHTARVNFLSPLTLYETYFRNELIAVTLQIWDQNPDLELMAMKMFHMKLNMVCPGRFDHPSSIKLIHLTRRPVVASLRLPAPADSPLDVAELVDEVVFWGIHGAYSGKRFNR